MKRFFKRGSGDSVQRKINELKQRQHKVRSGGTAAGAGIAESSPLPERIVISLEEQRYLDALSQQFKNADPFPDVQERPVAIPQPPPQRAAAAEQEPEVFMAEREVERLVRQGQARFEPSPPAQSQTRRETDTYSGSVATVEEDPKDAPPPKRPAAPPRASAPPSSPPPKASAGAESSVEQGNLPFPPGTLVRLSDDSLAVIKEEIRNREYDLVYILCANGRVEPRGVCLHAYEIERLGWLPPEDVEALEKSMVWDRDRIVYRLDDVSLSRAIPELPPGVHDTAKGVMHLRTGPSRAKPVKAEPVDDGHSLQRGRQLSVIFGDKTWEAVYFGSDSLGPIVAYSPDGEEWELMHLDLERFGSALKTGPLLSSDRIRALEENVVRKMRNPQERR